MDNFDHHNIFRSGLRLLTSLSSRIKEVRQQEEEASCCCSKECVFLRDCYPVSMAFSGLFKALVHVLGDKIYVLV